MLKNKLVSILAACALAVALPTAAFAAMGDWSAGGPNVDVSNEGTSAEYLYTCDVTVKGGPGFFNVAGPADAIGRTVQVTSSDGIIDFSGNLTTNPAGGSIFQVSADKLKNTYPETYAVKVVNPDYVAPTPAPTPTPGTDTPADTPAADDNADKATDESKTSPQTGVDSSSVAFVGMGSLIAAGCVAFAIRKKVISEK